MPKRNKPNNEIIFCGENADDVTGSQILIKFKERKILLECGLYQGGDGEMLTAYQINNKPFRFRPNELDIVFCPHSHIDHMGRLSLLYRRGFRGKIITTTQTAKIAEKLLYNCAEILESEAITLSKRYNRTYNPIYTVQDVEKTCKLFECYDEVNEIIKLDNTVSFKWLENSHCPGSTQLQLILGLNGETKKILYTSDLGPLKNENPFVSKTEVPSEFNDFVIMESTYGNNDTKRDKRKQDVLKMMAAISETNLLGGSIIMPAFSFNRTQDLLHFLYKNFKNEPDFLPRIIVDSKLTWEITKLYNEILKGKQLKEWEKVYSWDKVEFVSDYNSSQEILNSDIPSIIISSSGFCSKGRVVNYIKKYLPNHKTTIMFSGYAGKNESHLSYKIKNPNHFKSVKIDGKLYKNKANITELSSFSSHASFKDLVKYGSSLNTNKIILVHGETEAKKCLETVLTKALRENNSSACVKSAYKGLSLSI